MNIKKTKKKKIGDMNISRWWCNEKGWFRLLLKNCWRLFLGVAFYRNHYRNAFSFSLIITCVASVWQIAISCLQISSLNFFFFLNFRFLMCECVERLTLKKEIWLRRALYQSKKIKLKSLKHTEWKRIVQDSRFFIVCSYNLFSYKYSLFRDSW